VYLFLQCTSNVKTCKLALSKHSDFNSLYFFCELEHNQEFSSEAETLSYLFYLGFAKFRINLSKEKFYLQFFIILNDVTTVYTGQRSFYIA
jgi:hypothetical protein